MSNVSLAAWRWQASLFTKALFVGSNKPWNNPSLRLQYQLLRQQLKARIHTTRALRLGPPSLSILKPHAVLSIPVDVKVCEYKSTVEERSDGIASAFRHIMAEKKCFTVLGE